jgi:acetyl-CoA carboxylase biotin carboxylase subunit
MLSIWKEGSLVKRSFIGSAGRITGYLPPGGPFVRMDSHIYTDYVVPPSYDSLLGKVSFQTSKGRNSLIFFQFEISIHLWNPPHTDNVIDMCAQMIDWAPTREKAIDRMKRALNDTIITGQLLPLFSHVPDCKRL